MVAAVASYGEGLARRNDTSRVKEIERERETKETRYKPLMLTLYVRLYEEHTAFN